MTLIELFCFGARRQREKEQEDYCRVDEDKDYGDCCCDDDDDKSETTEVTSNTSTYKEYGEDSAPEVRVVVEESTDLIVEPVSPPPVSSFATRREQPPQDAVVSPAAHDEQLQRSPVPNNNNNNRRRRLPPRDKSKGRFKALVVPVSPTPAPPTAPSTTPAVASRPPPRRRLPPRDKTPRSNFNHHNNNNYRRRPTTSGEAIQNAVLVAQASSRGPELVTTTRPIVHMLPTIRANIGKQQTQPAVELDDQSRGMSLFSKPSVIQVENDPEEDFEKFNEVQDDDDLCLDGSNDEDMFHSQHNNSSSATVASSAASSIPHLPMALTEERVRAHLRDYYEDFDSIFRLGKSSSAAWESFFSQYFTPDIQWVRSSSNSLTGPELADHFAKDIVGVGMKLVSINSIQILALGLSAIVTFTADQKFIYRGTPNSDRTVITMVLTVDSSGHNNGKEIRIAHEHRCTGKPIPEDAEWD